MENLVITLVHILLLVLFNIIALALILPTKWFQNWIEKSIQYHYDTRLEDYRRSRTKKDKAEEIAKLFSLWIKYRGRERELLNKNELFERYEELNRMSLELSLWIEDVELLNDVMTRLQNADNSKSIYEIIGKVRKLILENEDDFDPCNIVLWPTQDEIDLIYGAK